MFSLLAKVYHFVRLHFFDGGIQNQMFKYGDLFPERIVLWTEADVFVKRLQVGQIQVLAEYFNRAAVGLNLGCDYAHCSSFARTFKNNSTKSTELV